MMKSLHRCLLVTSTDRAVRPLARSVFKAARCSKGADRSAFTKSVEYEGLVVPKDKQPLVTPMQLGCFQLQHRLAMAPLTRCRSINTVPPSEAAALYYSQRATPGGLLISEGTVVSLDGHGYPHTPGIHSMEQVQAWKPVVKAVKDKGAIFFCQLWHVGRASHSDYQPDGLPPKAPSPIPIRGDWQVYTLKGGPYDFETPREMTIKDVKQAVQNYVTAASNAMEAGFDGVEIHANDGFQVDQFLKDGMNQRTDEYGGSIENRARFALEVLDAVSAVMGEDRVGIRLSPFSVYLDASCSHPFASASYLLEELNSRNIAYVHLVEPRFRMIGYAPERTFEPFRKIYRGTLILTGGYDQTAALEALRNDQADVIGMGRCFLANPDLLKRFILNAPLNQCDPSTFYSQDAVVGYTDYPFLEDAKAETPDSSKLSCTLLESRT